MSSGQKLKLVCRFPSLVNISRRSISLWIDDRKVHPVLFRRIHGILKEAGLPEDQIQVNFWSSTCKVVAGPDDQAADPSGPSPALPVDQSQGHSHSREGPSSDAAVRAGLPQPFEQGVEWRTERFVEAQL